MVSGKALSVTDQSHVSIYFILADNKFMALLSHLHLYNAVFDLYHRIVVAVPFNKKNTMEIKWINKDIKVFYVTAKSFPDCAFEAHQTLHSLVPFTTNRSYYGISRPENGKIVYRAAAEEIEPEEGSRLGCDTLVLSAGNYISKTINGFMKNPQILEEVFKELLTTPNIDEQGYCVERYLTDDVVECMIRLKE